MPPRCSRPRSKWTGVQVGSSTEDSFIITGLVVGRTYTIRVRHSNSGGRVGSWNSLTHTVVGDIIPPADITAVVLTRSAGRTEDRWTNPADEDFSHVNVFVGIQADPPKISEISATSYDALGLAAGTGYNVRLQPVDHSGNEGNKTAVMAKGTLASTADGADTQTPDAPDVTLTPGGQQGRGYVILVTVERDGNAGERRDPRDTDSDRDFLNGIHRGSRTCGSLTGRRAGRSGRCGSDATLAGVGR